MLDAKPLDALEAIVRAGSFELAAQWLCITPSAVSQRIRQLEEQLGQTVLVRSQPVRPTPAGKRLLRHVRQLQLLEAELRHDLAGDVPDAFTTLAVAVNADSLETWFPEAIADCVAQENLLLQLIVDDQDYTHALLKNGDVIGCVTTQAQALTGCQSVCLGRMPYVCVATPAFARRYFAHGVSAEALRAAPAILFNLKDSLHLNFMADYGLALNDFPYFTVPAVHALLNVVLAGLGYGLTPRLQVADLLASGRLVDVLAGAPGPALTLYWHSWALQSPKLARFGAAVQAGAAQAMPPAL